MMGQYQESAGNLGSECAVIETVFWKEVFAFDFIRFSRFPTVSDLYLIQKVADPENMQRNTLNVTFTAVVAECEPVFDIEMPADVVLFVAHKAEGVALFDGGTFHGITLDECEQVGPGFSQKILSGADAGKQQR